MEAGLEAPARFGRQRAPGDIATLLLLLTGFSGLGVAFWILNSSVMGALLPIAFLAGTWQSLRTDVREIEVRGETLFVKTFLRSYPIPRAHIVAVVRAPLSTAVEVLNGRRYGVTPPGVSPVAVANALDAWMEQTPRQADRG